VCTGNRTEGSNPSPSVKGATTGFDFILLRIDLRADGLGRGTNPDCRPGAAKSVSVACDDLRYVYDKLLRSDGLFLVTAPMGHAAEWDATVFSDDLASSGFSQFVDIS
jgi:hypothetical protein